MAKRPSKRRSYKKLPYAEGTWFAVPLRSSGFGVGLVARMDGEGGVFGYFFGPRRDAVPDIGSVENLMHEQAVWMCQFGDLGFLESKWPIIGQSKNWNRDEWPLPPFIRFDSISGEARMSVYSDDLEFLWEQVCDPKTVQWYAEDGSSGYGAVEISLTRVLDSNSTQRRDSSVARSPVVRPSETTKPQNTTMRSPANRPKATALNRVVKDFSVQQAVTIYLPLSDGTFGSPEEHDVLQALEDQIAQAIEDAEAGEFDGNLFGQGECMLYTYGPDADRLFAAIEPVLKSCPLASGGYAIKRYGEASDLDAREVRVEW